MSCCGGNCAGCPGGGCSGCAQAASCALPEKSQEANDK